MNSTPMPGLPMSVNHPTWLSIRRLRAKGLTLVEIAERHSLTVATVEDVLNGTIKEPGCEMDGMDGMD